MYKFKYIYIYIYIQVCRTHRFLLLLKMSNLMKTLRPFVTYRSLANLSRPGPQFFLAGGGGGRARSLIDQSKTCSFRNHVSVFNFSTTSTIFVKMSSELKVISTSASAPPKAPYSQAIAVNGFIYLSGQIPMTSDGVLISDNVKAAALQSLQNIKAIVEAAGSSIDKIVKVTVYLLDMVDFKDVNEVYSEFFGTHRPARTCIAIHQLPLGARIEIEAIALQ
ncbi:Endoribonuclease L-PSP/chorismate mutase-like protein [Lipomyces japonicus]|uniref:Endoribonuclease L-PSP/chorismate mutase-like protein n=1 Tax=Lipomyces japonicus TaxID=56871 RepID=UPI0034CE6269